MLLCRKDKSKRIKNFKTCKLRSRRTDIPLCKRCLGPLESHNDSDAVREIIKADVRKRKLQKPPRSPSNKNSKLTNGMPLIPPAPKKQVKRQSDESFYVGNTRVYKCLGSWWYEFQGAKSRKTCLPTGFKDRDKAREYVEGLKGLT